MAYNCFNRYYRAFHKILFENVFSGEMLHKLLSEERLHFPLNELLLFVLANRPWLPDANTLRISSATSSANLVLTETNHRKRVYASHCHLPSDKFVSGVPLQHVWILFTDPGCKSSRERCDACSLSELSRADRLDRRRLWVRLSRNKWSLNIPFHRAPMPSYWSRGGGWIIISLIFLITFNWTAYPTGMSSAGLLHIIDSELARSIRHLELSQFYFRPVEEADVFAQVGVAKILLEWRSH